MKPGANTFGTGAANDIVFPKGLGPERIGTITVAGGKVTMKLAPGVTMAKDGVAVHRARHGHGRRASATGSRWGAWRCT